MNLLCDTACGDVMASRVRASDQCQIYGEQLLAPRPPINLVRHQVVRTKKMENTGPPPHPGLPGWSVRFFVRTKLRRLLASNSPIYRRSLRRREKTHPALNIKGEDEDGYQFRRRPSQSQYVCDAVAPVAEQRCLTWEEGASR